jgi:hypothetical protein
MLIGSQNEWYLRITKDAVLLIVKISTVSVDIALYGILIKQRQQKYCTVNDNTVKSRVIIIWSDCENI